MGVRSTFVSTYSLVAGQIRDRALLIDVGHPTWIVPGTTTSKSWPRAVKSPGVKVRIVDALPCSAQAPITALEVRPPATPCLSGTVRAFFAQRFMGPCGSIRGRPRCVFGGNSHEQAPLPLDHDRQRCRSNGDGAFFPANLERHSRLYPRFALNVFRNHQSPGMVHGGLHDNDNTAFDYCLARLAAGDALEF